MARYIDANALKIRVLANSKPRNHDDDEDGAFDRGYNRGIFAAQKEIDAAPTLSPDDVRGVGEWISAYCCGIAHKRCSECGTYVEDTYFAFDYSVNYCPSCGAKMKGGVD